MASVSRRIRRNVVESKYRGPPTTARRREAWYKMRDVEERREDRLREIREKIGA